MIPQKRPFLPLWAILFFIAISLLYGSALIVQVLNPQKDPWKEAFKAGQILGASECRSGVIKPQREFVDAVARREIGVEYKNAFVEGFYTGWDYPTVKP